MYSKFVKICSIILSVALLINLLPMQVLGAEIKTLLAGQENINSDVGYDNELAVSSDTTIIGEVVDKRTEFSKEYQLSNGMHMIAVYPRAVHYENNGKWDEIDNTLKIVGTGTNAVYANTAGSWDVRFPQTLTGEKTVSVSKDGYTLSFGMAGELRIASSGVIGGEVLTMGITQIEDVGETYSVAFVQSSTAQIYQATAVQTTEDVEYAETINIKTDSRVTYQNVYSNTNIVYDLLSNQIKETIILGNYDVSLRGYRYTLDTETLIPVLNDDNSIDLYDANKSNIIFTMPAPFMIDNAGEFCNDVDVTLIGTRGTYTLSYLLPVTWLAAEERSWPVVLDPVITEHSSQENIQDQTVTEEQVPNPSTGVLQLGWREDWGTMRFFMKFNEIPELTSADVVVNAQIGLYKAQTSNTTVPVTVHKVLGDWSEDTITWSNKPAFDTTIEDYYLSKTVGMHYWDVTDIVRGWYETGNNYGMMFKVVDDYENLTSNNFRQYYSPDYSAHPSDYGLYPGLWVTFRNYNGLESYLDYTSSSAGRAGTGYVNNYTGNLVWIHGDIGFGGNRMPVSISHVYNANDSALNTFGLGYGWRTNFNQTAGVWYRDSSYYYWEDGDGTKHYFKSNSDGIYEDEDGLELTLSTSNNEITITDKNGNKSFFDSQGRLYKMENNQATKSNIIITYLDSTSKQISTITDGVGRKYSFIYPNGLLSKISYLGTGTTEISYVTFGYTGSLLTSVEDKDEGVSQFTYSGNYLASVQDVDGYKLQYTYSLASPKRVVGISEYDGAVAGGHMTIQYAHNQTTFTDHNQNVKIIQFNDWGNVISVQDDQGRAQHSQYARNAYTDNTSKANQMRLSSKLQNTVINLFKDNSFELGTTWSALSTDVTSVVAADTAYYGIKSLKMTRATPGAASGVRYTAGNFEGTDTFTFSAYVKTDATASAYLSITTSTGEVVNSEVLQPGSDWTRLQVTCTPSEYGRLYAQLMTETAGTVYIDCVQFERAAIASRYNLVNNGDFRYGDHGWSRGSLFTSTEKCVTATSAGPGINGTVYSITGDPNACKHLYQIVDVSGGVGDTYVVAGWARGDSAPLYNSSRQFSLVITFINTDGTITRGFAKFNPDTDSSNGWKHAAGVAVANKTYSAIHVEAQYDNNVNTAYFDAIQLFKEEFGTSYTYDDDGNVTSVVDLQNQTTTYEYTDNNLTRIIQPSGTLTYTYDDYHNVKTATSSTGEKYTFVYDYELPDGDDTNDYGNNVSVSIGEGNTKITISATYTEDGNYLESTINDLANVTNYCYNEDTGVLEWVQYPNDTTESKTTYTYDDLYRIETASATVPGLTGGTALTAGYTYEDDLLTKVQTGSTTYSFAYGDFAQRTSVSIGDRLLAAYTYTQDANRYLSALNYGNGDFVQYTYDDHGRVTKETDEDGQTVTYSYDNSGLLATVTDSETGRKITYYYDLIDRLGKYKEVGSNYEHSVAYTYDTRNNLSKLVETINGTEHVTDYTYDEANRVETVTANGITRTYTYDAYGRMTRMEDTQGETSLQTIVYTYHDTAERASTRIATMRTTRGTAADVTYSYTYDDNGNILSVNDGTNTTSYVYDTANQLIRENNQGAGRTWTWVYDNAGNIVSRKEYAYTTGDLGTPVDTVSYTYGDSAWGDLLTAYNGQTITYDPIGNPLNDGTWTYTWQNGRELASMSNGTTAWNYTYDGNSMRTSRTNGAKTYNYVYNGSQLTQMTVGNDTLYFTYGALGPTTVTWNGTTYYYALNVQGDVIGIFKSDGNLAVFYNWDNAWGYNPEPEGPLADTLGTLNPLRYRGYVYDTETGFYYLQSRYYDPEIGRFINADVLVSTGQGMLGNNMFAYCRNNPVRRKDVSGATDVEIFDDDSNLLDDDKLIHGGTTKSSSPSVNNGPRGNGSLGGRSGGKSVSVSNGNPNPNVSSGQTKSSIFGPDQQALLDLAKEVRRGVTLREAEILVDYAKEYGITYHEPMMHINRAGIWGDTLHIKIKNIHIPVYM